MKIVILQGAFLPVPPINGGAVEKIWHRLGQEFAKSGHTVIHISRAHPTLMNQEVVNAVHYIRIKGFDTPASSIKLKILDLIYSIRSLKKLPLEADIIITNTFWSPVLISGVSARKVYVSVERVPKGQMRFYKNAGRLRANSSYVEQCIKKEIPASEHTRVKMIPNPLPIQNLPEVNFDAKQKIILYTGRLHPEKGIDLLVRAFKMVRSSWKLKIVGPWEIAAGGGGQAYLDSLRLLSGEANVEFTGPIYDPEHLNEIYHQSSIFVYPSIAEKGETFGLAPLEAMAWGCAPIVSNLACFTDFIVDGKNGLVFNHRSENSVDLLKDSIERLEKDSFLRHELSINAMDVRRTHSSSFIASLFLKDFETMLNIN